jgi:hypothetical protein
VGLLFGSPAFAEASKYYNPLRIIALGLGAWCASTAGCAAATSFGTLLFFRCLVRLRFLAPARLCRHGCSHDARRSGGAGRGVLLLTGFPVH